MKTSVLLKRFVPYYRPYIRIMAADLFCAALTTVCELILPLILRYVTGVGMNDLSSLTVRTILTIGGIYFGLRILDGMASFYMAYTGHVMGAAIETDMRQDAFDHLQKLSDHYFSNTKVGQIMSRITSDLFDVTEFAHHCPEEFFIAFLKAAVAFLILAQINLALTLILFVLIPVMAVSCSYFNIQVRKAFKRQRNHIGELNARIEDSLLGNKVVRAFANEDVERQKFNRDNREFLQIKRQTYKYMAAFQNTIRIFDGLMYVVVIVAGGLFMIRGRIAPADLVAYTMYVTTLLATIRRIIEFAEQFQRGMTGIERFTELMDAKVDIFDEEGAKPLADVEGKITFDHVSFAYPDDEQTPVLADINLTIQPGEKIALVGPSGGGKTTLCNLIPRFYDPTAGGVLLDGQDVRNVTLKSLRENVGVVQQDVYLFSGSVYENIEYGRPGAGREEVIAAARLAGAHDFIMQLKDGYDTYVGERGVKLSGGQKQRISIARVFLKAPKVLLLDEATAALDNQTAFSVTDAILHLDGLTRMVVTHRLEAELLAQYDEIFVLRGGEVCERGKFDDLMERKEYFYSLYNVTNG